MRDNTTLTAREQAVVRINFAEKDKQWVRYSRHTFDKLTQELREMPHEEVARLPDDIRPYAIGLRDNLDNGQAERIYNKSAKAQESKEVIEKITIEPNNGKYLDLAIESNEINIEEIIIRTSYLYGIFYFLIFEEKCSQEFPDQRDTFLFEECGGQRITHIVPSLSTYQDLDGCKHLHCGIALRERLPRFDLNDQDLEKHLQSPVDFTLTLYYSIPT